MAVVGEAHIIVRAITNQVEKDIRRGFRGISGAGSEAGDNLGRSFRRALDKQMSASAPGKLADALRGLVPDAERVYLQFRRLTRIGFAVQGGFGAIAGSIGAIIGGLGALIGVAGGAAAALVAVAGAAASIGTAFGLARFAFGGIGEALQQTGGGGGGAEAAREANNAARVEAAQRRLAEVIEQNRNRLADANNQVADAQERLNRALRDGREELQQIAFSAEEAALEEQAAALELEKARETLQRVQDLAPSDRRRREAELAYAQAELGLRRAQDAASDLAAEEQRLSRLGVDGLDEVIDAREELRQAEEDRAQVARENALDQLDAEADLRDAIRQTTDAITGSGGAVSAYNKLTESQRKFVDYLKQIKPLFAGLREDVARGFLPVLQTQIQRFIDAGLVEVLSDGFTEVGIALGEASKLFTDAFLNSRGLDNLSSFFSTTAQVAPTLGRTLGLSFGAFLKILQAAEPLTRRFVEFIEGKAEAFENFINVEGASGRLEAFFTRAGDLASRFGDVFGNIFGFLGDVIMANFGPGSGGDMFLSWLQKVTQGFNDIDPTFLEKYFRGAAQNSIALLDSFGILFEILIRAGDDPGIKGFYDNLNQGASALATIVRESVAAAPSLGRFLALITKIIAIFADSGSVKAFFDTLNVGLGAVLNILEAIKPAIDFIGPIFATITAITLMGSTLLTVGKIFTGFGIIALTNLAKIPALASLAGSALTAMGTSATAVTTATTAAGAAATKAGVATAAAGTMSVAAWLPFLAIAAPIAGVFAIWSYESGKTKEAIEDASVSITNGFQSGADAADIFASSLEAVNGPAVRELLSTTEGLQSAFVDLKKVQDAGTFGWLNVTTNSRALDKSLTAVGNSLGNLATTNLQAAQTQFAKFTSGLGLNRAEMQTALTQMESYRTALIDQASQMGINILGTNGMVDEQLLLNFALGQGEVASRRAQEAERQRIEGIRALNQALSEGAQRAVGFGQATDIAAKGTEVNFEQTVKNLQAKANAAAQFFNDLLTLQQKGLSQQAIDFLKQSGDQGVALARDLVTRSSAELQKFDSPFRQMEQQASPTFARISTAISTALDGGKIGTATADRLRAQLSSATTIGQMNTVGQQLAKAIDTSVSSPDQWKKTADSVARGIDGASTGQTVANGITGAIGSSTTINNASNAGARIRSAVQKNFNEPIIVTIKAEYKAAEGGFIRAATGGLIRGPGSGTSDSIPAMLSNGEYVINARATSLFRPLLDAINYGKPVPSPVVTSTVGATPSSTTAPNINITVNPSAGMDERELAKLVSKEIAYSMRKGAMS